MNKQVLLHPGGLLLAAAFSLFTVVGRAQCSQPSNLNATNLTPNSTQLDWSAVQNSTSYRVQYRIQGLNAWTAVNGLQTTTATLNGLQVNTIYEWRVKANCSTYSSIAVFNSGGSGNNTSCSQPSNMESNVLSQTSVLVTWSEIAEAFNYRVRYRVSGAPGGWIILPPVTANSYTFTGLLPNTEYEWRVKASCSVSSSVALFNTGNTGGGGQCSAPSNTNTIEVLPTSASVEWEAVQQASSYTVQYRVENAPVYQTAGTTSNNTLLITGLVPNTQYAWRVTASCSPAGSDVQFTTPGLRIASTTDEPSIKVSADVAAQQVLVRTIDEQNGLIQLLDASGREVTTTVMTGNSTRIDVAGLRAGTYVVRAVRSDGTVAVERFAIVQ